MTQFTVVRSKLSRCSCFRHNTLSQVRFLGITAPEKPSASWERGAKLVKNTDVDNPYLEHIRKEHDPSMHLKTIEDELRGTMGKALGKQGEKISRALSQMKQEFDLYQELSAKQGNGNELKACVERYNEYRQLAIKARWELLVHRQAVGFIVNNHKFVHEHFPIPDALSESSFQAENDDMREDKVARNKKSTTKQFGDQLDWWQRIGRWR